MSHARRLQRELQKMHQDIPPGIRMVSTENFAQWQMDIEVLDQNPIYYGKIFRLSFKFTDNYPIEAPEVMFIIAVDREIPMHPHIYSNGVICLDLLSSGNGWSPVQSVESVCMSIQSMLTGNTKNERPRGDEQFVLSDRRSPRHITFVYDDHTV